jgi:hypothetical protein
MRDVLKIYREACNRYDWHNNRRWTAKDEKMLTNAEVQQKMDNEHETPGSPRYSSINN